MATNEKRLSLVVDPTKAEEGANKVKKALDGVKDKVKSLEDRMTALHNAMKGFSDTKQLDGLSKGAKKTKTSIDDLVATNEKLKSSLNSTGKAILEENGALKAQADAVKKSATLKERLTEASLKQYEQDQRTKEEIKAAEKAIRDKIKAEKEATTSSDKVAEVAKEVSKEIVKQADSYDNLVKAERDYQKISGANAQVWHDSIAVMKEGVKVRSDLAVSIRRSEGYLQSERDAKLELDLVEKDSINRKKQEIAERRNLTTLLSKTVTVEEKLANQLANSTQLLSAKNAEARKANTLNQQQITIGNQMIKLEHDLTDEGKAQVAQLARMRAERKAYYQEVTEAAERAAGVIKDVTEADRVQEDIVKRKARAEALYEAAQDGSLKAMLEKEKATKDATKAIREAINAMSDEEKRVSALEKANEKLERTYYAEEARLKALTTELGRKSVATQEQRRITEELIRSTERLALMESEQGKQLVQNRVRAEMLAKAYREEITGSTKNATKSVDGLRSAFSALGTALSGVAVYFSGMGLARVADDYTNITNRLLAVSDATTDVTQKTRDMLEMSIENRSTLDATMDVYAKMTRANEKLGKSQQEITDLTNAVSKAVSMSGASAAGAEGAMLQFSQALSNDFTASAQELNSIIEQTPALANYMAQGLRNITGDATITAASLKRMGTEGKLSAELMVDGLLSVLPDIEEAFGRTSATIDSAMKNLKDSFTLAIGEMDDLYEVSESITESLKEFNKELPDLKDEIAGVTASIATFISAAALGGLATMLGPVGWAITGVASAVALLTGSLVSSKVAQDSYIKNLEDLIKENDNATESLKAFNEELERGNVLKQQEIHSGTNAALDETNQKLKEAEENLRKLQTSGSDNGSNSLVGNAGSWNKELTLAIRAVEELTIKRDRLLAQSLDSMFASDANATNSMNDSISALQIVLSKIPSELDPLVKAQETYQTTVQSIRKHLEAVKANAELMRQNGLVTEADTKLKEANEAATKGLTQASLNFQEALWKVNEEEAKLTPLQQRNEEIRKSIALLEEQVEALNLGGDAYKSFLEKQEAASQLGFDSASLVPDDLQDKFEKIVTLIRERNEALASNTVNTAFKLNAEGLDDEIEALSKGKDAYKEYMLTKQATQMLGGVVGIEDLNLVDELATKLKEAAEQRKALSDSEQRADNIKAFKEEYNALLQGEKEYQDLLLRRRAAQMLVLEDTEENKDQITSLYDQLKEFENLKIDPFENAMSSIEDGISSFQDLASVVGAGSKEMEVAMAAVNLAQATYAVLNQASGDPYTAFARMAAMAASVASLGQSLGNLQSGVDISAARQESQGTGTVLGDATAKSESILNATEYSADALEDLVGINSGMLDELKNLNNVMSSAADLITRDVNYEGIATGLGLTSIASTVESFGSGAGKLFDSLFGGLTGGLFEGLLGGIGGFLGGGLFGSSSVSDEGVQILGGTLQEILEETTAQAYQTVSKKSWFSSSTSNHFQDVTEAVESQFDLVFQSLFSTVESAMLGLGYEYSDFQQRLESFQVEAFKISLKDLSSEEQLEEINAVFSKTFDQLATAVAPILAEFQEAGEGMGETLARVSTNFQVTNEAIRQLDLSAMTGTTDNILRASEAFIGMFDDASDAASSFTGFVDTFATDERKLEILTEGLTTALGEQDLAILNSRDGVYEYISALDVSNEAEAKRLANILGLTDSLDEYFNLLEDVTEEIEGLVDLADNSSFISNFYTEAEQMGFLVDEVKEVFEELNLALPTTKQEFRDLVEAQDLTTNSGREAYNSLIGISGSINTLADYLDVAETSVDDLASSLSTLQDGLESTTDLLLSAFSDYVSDLITGIEDDLDVALTRLEDTYLTDKETLEDSLESLLESNTNSMDSLKDTISDLSSVVSSLKSAADSLQSEVVSQEINRASALSTIRNFLVTGDTSGVEDAASVLSSLDTTGYSSSASYNYDRAVNLAMLRQAEESGQITLSMEEQNLKALEDLEDQLRESNEDQLEALKRKYDSDKEDLESLAQEQIDYYQNSLNKYDTQIDLLRNINVSFSSFAQAISLLEGAISSEVSGAGNYTNQEVQAEMDRIYAANTTDGVVDTDTADYAIGLAAIQNGVTSTQVAAAAGVSREYILQRASELGLPQFANGLEGGFHNGGLAVLGDKFGVNSPSAELAITPPSYFANGQQMMSMLDNTSIVEELKALRQEVVNLRAEAKANVKYSKSISDTLDEWDSGGVPDTRTI